MKRVLIVEDALDLGRMLRLALETLDRSLSVRVIQSAEEALLELTSAPPVALIISDIRLPGMSGFDLLKKVRLRSPESRIMLITGLGDETVLRQAAEARVDRFMRKPIEMSEFLNTAAELLDIQTPAAGEALPVQSLAPPAPREDLPSLLTRLRRELGAALALLCDDHGRVVAQAGEMSGLDFERQWAPQIMAALSAAAKTARLVRSGLPLAVLALRGDEQHLLLAPVGAYALVMVENQDHSGLRTALAFEALLRAQVDLAAILTAMGVEFYPRGEVSRQAAPPPSPAAEAVEQTAPPDETPLLDKLELHLQRGSGLLDPQQVADFWDAAADEQPLQADNPDALTYEQARQLGLAPDENER
ncbi:MAG: response regulator [Chloroflexota bacterium]